MPTGGRLRTRRSAPPLYRVHHCGPLFLNRVAGETIGGDCPQRGGQTEEEQR